MLNRARHPAASGRETAAPPSSVMNSRRLTSSTGAPPALDQRPADGPCRHCRIHTLAWRRVGIVGTDLNCSESSPDRCCPAVVSLKFRIEPTRAYESFDRAGLLRLSRGLATDAPARLRGKGRGRSNCGGNTPIAFLTQINFSPRYLS